MTVKVTFLNPFVKAAYIILQRETQAVIKKGAVSWQESYFTLRDISVSISVSGKVEGIALYGMDERTAKNIAGAMLSVTVPIFDRLAESAIAELGNMITGMASADLENAGFPCHVAPPTVITGRGTIISTVNIKSILLPLETQHGIIDISLALEEGT